MKNFITLAILFIVCAVLIGLPETYGQTPVPVPVPAGQAVKHAIKSVTVYPDRALVVRSAMVEVGKGTRDIVFDDLPAALRPESVRAKGTEKIMIANILVKSRPLVRPEDSGVQAAQKKVEGIEKEMREMQDETALLSKKVEFLDSIKLKAGEQASKGLEAGLDLKALAEVMKFLDSGYAEIVGKKRNLDYNMKDANERLLAARRELQALQSKMSLTRIYAVVSVSAAENARGEIELSYIVGGAYWRAEYDLRADSNAENADLVYYGVVQQQSGEDWIDAQIMLTTAQPAVGAAPPELQPRYLQIYQPRPADGREDFNEAGKARTRYEELGGAMAAPETAKLQVLARAGLAVTYVLPGKETVPSGPEPKRLTIATTALKPEKTFITIPALSEFVYHQAEFTNTSELAFLSGRVSVFVGPDYIGMTYMPEVAPSEKFKINFGVDREIKVKRERIKRFEEDLGKSKKRITYEYKITLQSYKAQAAAVVVKDQIPVSMNENIEVKLLKAEPTPEHEINRKDENNPAVIAFKEKGVIEWRIALAPDPKKETVIIFSYKVEYPADAIVGGLE